MYLGFRLTGGADVMFWWNLLAEETSGKSSDLAAGRVDGVVALDDVFESLVDVPPSRSAEFRRIMIVLVFGNFRLCSRRPSSLYMLQALDFLTAICVKLNLGGTGGGDTSLGGNSGASGACRICANRTASDSCFSRRRGGNGGGIWQKLWAFGTLTCGEMGIGPNSCISVEIFECFGLTGYATAALVDAPSSL